jgi:T5orf172 domain
MKTNGKEEGREGTGRALDGRSAAGKKGRRGAGESTHEGAASGDRPQSGADALERGGFVYFLETHDGGFVKIGFTRNLARRFDQTRRLLPGLRVLGYLPGAMATESWLHAKFAAQRERGEWFRSHEELRSFIQVLGLIEFAPVPPKRVKAPKPPKVAKPKPAELPRQIEIKPLVLEPKPVSVPLETAEHAELYRRLGQHLGKTYGAKGAAATNAKLKPKQRKANAKKAGQASAAALTPKQRSERARKAALARYAKKEENKDGNGQ